MTKREEIEELKRRVRQLEEQRFVPSPYQTGSGVTGGVTPMPMKCVRCGTAFFGTHICASNPFYSNTSFGETGNELQ